MFEKKKLTLLFVLFIILALALVTSVGGEGNNSSASITINEIRYTHEDRFGLHEYFELGGAPGSSVDDLTYLVIDQDGGSDGIIVSVTELVGTVPADGYYLAVEDSWVLGGNPDLFTSFWFVAGVRANHMLVRDFIGNLGDDLDFNNDGILDDAPPWSSLEDCLTLEGSFPGVGYCETANGPDGIFPPAHSYLCQDGWRIGSFFDFSFDTPGERNDVCHDGGLGPGEEPRVIQLHPVSGLPAFEKTHGMVEILQGWSEEHPQYSDPPSIQFTINLPCNDYIFFPPDPRAGRVFWAIYVTTETVPRTRLQSFGGCGGKFANSLISINSSTIGWFAGAELLLEEDVIIEVMLEVDDGLDSDFVILRGEDLID